MKSKQMERDEILFPEESDSPLHYAPPSTFSSSTNYSTSSTKSNGRRLGFYDQLVRGDQEGWKGKANYAHIFRDKIKRNSAKNHCQKDNAEKIIAEFCDQPDLPAKTCALEEEEGEDDVTDNMELCPPNITDISGALQNKNSSRAVVRPIAFKPVTPSRQPARYTPDERYTPTSYDDGYSSHDVSRSCSHSTTISRDSEYYMSPHSQPSPLRNESSASRLDMESMLLEKEAEIKRIRETMEHNENAIMRVHEQKRVEWESQMKELTQEYHRRLRLQQEQALNREDDLRHIVTSLESDNHSLSQELHQVSMENDHYQDVMSQNRDLQRKNQELGNKVNQLTCECDSLRKEISDLDKQNQQLSQRLASGKLEQTRLEQQLSNMDIRLKSNDHSTPNQIEKLKKQLEMKDKELEDCQDSFQQEREKWEEEKLKVLQYQKQLQQTYVQMYRRNIELERQLCRISTRRHNSKENSLNRYEKSSIMSVDLDSNPESFC